jgi:maltose O-acetyltransferase
VNEQPVSKQPVSEQPVSEHKRRMLAGEPYLAHDPGLVADRLRCAEALARFNGLGPGDEAGRRAILGALLGRIGADSIVVPPFRCDYGFPIRVGARCFINYEAIVLDCAPVVIGDDVQVGPRVQLLTATHPLDPAERATGRESAKPITIGDGAWLGGGVIVCPGVTIGAGTVVGAGAVVVRDLPAGVLAAGNPARVIREL